MGAPKSVARRPTASRRHSTCTCWPRPCGPQKSVDTDEVFAVVPLPGGCRHAHLRHRARPPTSTTPRGDHNHLGVELERRADVALRPGTPRSTWCTAISSPDRPSTSDSGASRGPSAGGPKKPRTPIPGPPVRSSLKQPARQKTASRRGGAWGAELPCPAVPSGASSSSPGRCPGGIVVAAFRQLRALLVLLLGPLTAPGDAAEYRLRVANLYDKSFADGPIGPGGRKSSPGRGFGGHRRRGGDERTTQNGQSGSAS